MQLKIKLIKKSHKYLSRLIVSDDFTVTITRVATIMRHDTEAATGGSEKFCKINRKTPVPEHLSLRKFQA